MTAPEEDQDRRIREMQDETRLLEAQYRRLMAERLLRDAKRPDWLPPMPIIGGLLIGTGLFLLFMLGAWLTSNGS